MELDTSTKKYKGWFMVPNAIIDSVAREIGTGPFAVYLCLKRHEDRMGVCFPSIATIALKMSMSSRSVIRHMKVLTEYGLVERIEKSHRHNGGWLHNTYRVDDKKYKFSLDCFDKNKVLDFEEIFEKADFSMNLSDEVKNNFRPGDKLDEIQMTQCHTNNTHKINTNPSVLQEDLVQKRKRLVEKYRPPKGYFDHA